MKRLVSLFLFSALPLFGQSSPDDLIPNRVKYADTGAKPASGRSGSAAVEARALLGRDGATSIELTTGSFESGTAGAGSIDRVQVKQNYQSDAAITQNVDTSGSFVTVPMSGLVWREPIQLQARVSGIDPARTDVVTLETTVKRRPNLIIAPEAPLHAIAGVPYSVNVAIYEVNRDLGARATCVMRVNGAEVDRAEGIWVNAGGRVVCNMLHTFDTAGPQQLEFALIDQSPADWDMQNNSARMTVNVYSGAQEMTSWNVRTSEETRVERSSGSGSNEWWQEGGESYESMTSQRTEFSGLIAGPFNLDNLAASFYERTDDGAPLYELPVAQFYPDYYWSGEGCRFSDRRYAYMTVCSDGAITSLSYYRGSADVVYISKQWMYWLQPDGTWRGFSYVMSMPRKANWRTNYGDTVSIEFRLSDGNNLFEAARTMPLTVDGPHETASSGCYSGWLTGCWTRSETVTTKSATASHN